MMRERDELEVALQAYQELRIVYAAEGRGIEAWLMATVISTLAYALGNTPHPFTLVKRSERP